MPTSEQVQAWILNKMKRQRLIGGKHTDIRNIRKGAPQQFYEQIDDELGKLIKEGLVSVKPTAYGKHVQLNPRALGEINERVRRHFTEQVFG
jgi:hypothetical protein